MTVLKLRNYRSGELGHALLPFGPVLENMGVNNRSGAIEILIGQCAAACRAVEAGFERFGGGLPWVRLIKVGGGAHHHDTLEIDAAARGESGQRGESAGIFE